MAEETRAAPKPKRDSMSTARQFTSAECAEATTVVICELAEDRGWLASKWWRGAWWIRGTAAERAERWLLLGDAGDVVRWLDPECGGSVWVGLAPTEDHLRVVAVSSGAADVRGAVLPWDGLREAALDSDRKDWLHWWQAMDKIQGRVTVPPEDLKEGRIGVFELPEGAGAVIGRIHEVQRGRVLSVKLSSGPESAVAVKAGGRGWAWSDKWRDAAAHLMVERKGAPFKSVDSALWTVVHKRKRMIREGLLPPDPSKEPAA